MVGNGGSRYVDMYDERVGGEMVSSYSNAFTSAASESLADKY